MSRSSVRGCDRGARRRVARWSKRWSRLRGRSVAAGGLESISNQIGRLRELSIQAQNGTLSDADRDLIQIEFDSVAAEITRTAQSTEFNGHSLLNGDISGSGSLTLTDAFGSDLDLDVADHSASALGLEGISVSDPNTLTALDDALNQVSASRASLGATINTIDHRVQSQRQHALNVAESRSRIEDADVAAEIANLVRNQQLVKAHSGLTKSFLERTTGMLDLLT